MNVSCITRDHLSLDKPIDIICIDFGFLDGIAQPVISGFRAPLPGQAVLPAGSFLLNEEGDTITTRPPWAKDGSFLAFRKLQQFVPEFNKYLLDNPTNGSSELTGARMVGRWKSVSLPYSQWLSAL